MSKIYKGGLSELAKNAKQRLKSNNYQHTGNVVSINTAASLQSYIQKPKQNLKQPTQSSVIASYDDLLYKKVCDILDGKEEVINPVSELIDRKIFNTLEATQKQKYINNLIEKYKQLKQRYYREHYSCTTKVN